MTPTQTRNGVLAEGTTKVARDDRLDDGADELTSRRRFSGLLGNERLLLAVAATLMVAGIGAIVLGWVGASRAIAVEKQVPYLISGGLLGVALATIGALTFFTHWLAALLRELRETRAELADALRDLKNQRR